MRIPATTLAPCFRLVTAIGLLAGPASQAAIGISGVADKTKYDNSVTFTVTADPNAATTTATLDGVPVAVGSGVLVNSIRYHELRAESRTAEDLLVDSKLVRFIVRDYANRGGTEDGIPPHGPLRTVNDAPSAFVGGTLAVVAPAAWPAGLPIPLAAVLRTGENEPLRLNGVVGFGGLPGTTLQLRRGWGSVLAPAVGSPGTIQLAARVNGLSHDRAILIEERPVFTEISGSIDSDTEWPAHSRIHVAGTLTVSAGATLTVGEGSIVTLFTGSGSVGSAAEIVVNGGLAINGSEANPVVFGPDQAGASWGGIELPVATSKLTASHTIFTGSGEDQGWFNSHSGYSTHKPEQALFLIAGSGSGTAVGAELHLTECYCFSLAGQEMNSKTNTWIDLQRTLMQRAVTCGELNGSKVTIDRSALIEFPSEDASFADADNDAIYLTNGELAISRTVIGFTKDDGVDSGGSGGDNPYTAAADVTPLVSQNNWFEGTFHEGNSLSGTRNVSHSGCVFLHCGQGVEDGYSSSSTSDGPNAVIDGCLFVANMVGVRWGDNYGSGYSYNASMEVKNSIVLHSLFKDAFSGNWHPTQANAWIYQTMATNSHGRAYFNVHDSLLSQPDPVNHPAAAVWDPQLHAALLEPFMPVPGAAVGVAVCSYADQDSTARYPGSASVRLSSFSSKEVSVDWSLVGKLTLASEEVSLAGGSLVFAPGETIKQVSAPLAKPGAYALLRIALSSPVNAEVTGDTPWWYSPGGQVDGLLVARGSDGWRYRETRSDPPAEWKELGFDDSSPAANEWLAATMPAGYGTFSGVTFATTVASGPSNDRTKAFYFRKKFKVADPAQVASLTLKLRRDDGVVAWLNHDASPAAVSADGTFAGPYSYATLAPNATNTGTYFSYNIPVAKLVAGDNVLALELHQTSLTSGDALIDCELSVTYQQPLVLTLGRAGEGAAWLWSDPAAVFESSDDLQTWVPWPGATSPVPLLVEEVPGKYFRLRK